MKPFNSTSIASRHADTILIVDDEIHIINAIKRALLESPYEIFTATSEVEAQKILETEPVDVLLTDLMMPEMSGIELIRQARKLQPFSLQTIVLTGHGTMETAIDAMRLGASDYLLKPFDNETLLQCLAAAIERAQEIKDAQQKIIDAREKVLSIFENVQAGIMLVDDASSKIVDINPAACDMIGAGAAEIIGKIYHKFICSVGLRGCPRVDMEKIIKNTAHSLITWTGKQLTIIQSVSKIQSAGRILRLITFMDMSEQEHLRGELAASQEAFHSIVEKSHDGIVIVDAAGITKFANPAVSALFGWTKDQMHGQVFGYPIVPGDSLEIDIAGHKTGALTAEMRVAESEWQGEKAYVATLRDISERKKAESDIQSIANHDQLTGLPNRRLLFDRLGVALALAKRNARGIAVFYMDLDGFKPINDTYGHDVGDAVLKAIASRLSETVRSSDTIARVGGDEFVLLLSEVSDQQDIVNIAKKVIAMINTPITISEQQVQVGCSIGISLYPKDGTNHFELLKNADTAMYQVKDSGKNAYGFFQKEC